jgi:Tol biopolymer transport system component
MAHRRGQPLVVGAIGVAVLAASILLGGGGAATESHRQSHWIAFTRFVPALDDDATFVANLATGKVRRLFPGASNSPHWSPDGRLVTILGCGNPPACTTAAILVNPDTGHYRVLLMPAPNRIFTACNIWSRDGRRLACEGEGLDDSSLTGVYTMRVAGGGLRRVTWNTTGGFDSPADYSADGTRLLFTRSDPGRPEGSDSALFVKNLIRHKTHRITPWGFSDGQASWSPTGGKIAFEHLGRLYIAHPNGDPMQRVRLQVRKGYGAGDFAWSPDGKRLAFILAVPKADGGYREGIAGARADGSHVRWITTSPTFDHQPDWRPIPFTHEVAEGR